MGGVTDRRYYYIKIINTDHHVALKCRGDIILDGNAYISTWKKNGADILDIARRELLFLFEVMVFTKDSKREEKLYLNLGEHTMDDKSMADYDNKIDKEMTVLIHSENAEYPKESEFFRKTLQAANQS